MAYHTNFADSSEPFAVADDMEYANKDEEEACLSVDSAQGGVAVNQPLWYCGNSGNCRDGNQYGEVSGRMTGSLSCFSTHFRSQRGMTPGEYREMNGWQR